jgi:hypothetical protein
MFWILIEVYKKVLQNIKKMHNREEERKYNNKKIEFIIIISLVYKVFCM